MILEHVDSKPVKFKKFKKRVPAENPSVNLGSLEGPATTQTSFVDKLKQLIIDSEPLSQPDISKQKIVRFNASKIIDWNENNGRFALSENILKQNDQLFIAMQQRMHVMTDADGCGGRNEMQVSSQTLELGVNKITSINDFRNEKTMGNSHKEGKHEHCKKCGEDLNDGKCTKCAA